MCSQSARYSLQPGRCGTKRTTKEARPLGALSNGRRYPLKRGERAPVKRGSGDCQGDTPALPALKDGYDAGQGGPWG